MNREHRLVRVRLSAGKGTITYKSSKDSFIERVEIETEIPKDVALALLDQCVQKVEKMRYEWFNRVDGKIWEIDVFEGDNQGLIVAEIELGSETEPFNLPEWCGEEVTHDVRFNNNQLCAFPYNRWGQSIIELAANMFDLTESIHDMYVSWNPHMTDGFIMITNVNQPICKVSDVWKESFSEI